MKKCSVAMRGDDVMIDKKATGIQICIMAEKAGFNQAELARKMDLSAQVINRWVNGKTLPSPGYFLKISRIIGCTIEDLLIEEKSDL